jgi:hypothetical protein
VSECQNLLVRVIGLGAWCDYDVEDEYGDELNRSPLSPDDVADALDHFRRSASFRVAEFAVLADGRRLPLKDERSGRRGFSTFVHTPAGSEPGDIWAYRTLDGIEAGVRTTVLPDDDDTEDEHPWQWLAEHIRAHGVEVTPEQLKRLPSGVTSPGPASRIRPRVARASLASVSDPWLVDLSSAS